MSYDDVDIKDFDYNYYKDNNPDLRILCETMTIPDKKLYLYKHFINHGQFEKRTFRLFGDLHYKEVETIIKYSKSIIDLRKDFKTKIKSNINDSSIHSLNNESKKNNKERNKNHIKDRSKEKIKDLNKKKSNFFMKEEIEEREEMKEINHIETQTD